MGSLASHLLGPPDVAIAVKRSYRHHLGMDSVPRGDLEARLRRLEDLEEIRTLYVDYGRHLDDGDPVSYAGLFAHNAKLRLGPVMRGDGREEIKRAAALVIQHGSDDSKGSVHLIDSPRIQLDGDVATGECVWAAISTAADGQPRILVGRHLDQLVREGGHWRFSLRRGVFDIGPPGLVDAPKDDRSSDSP